MRKTVGSILAILLISLGGQSFAANKSVVDVTNGSKIRGIITASDAAGYAKIGFDGSTFHSHENFEGLTDPIGDDFYEGWLVRQDPFAFISTGKLEKKDDAYTNIFTSPVDYSDYDFYVLTIEPNDGNDAPADHILEGDATIVDGSVFLEKAEMMKQDDVMMDKKEIMKKDKMLMKDDMMMKKMTDRQNKIAMKIESRIGSLTDTQKSLLLTRVKDLQSRLSTLNVSDSKRAAYAEILEVLVIVLS